MRRLLIPLLALVGLVVGPLPAGALVSQGLTAREIAEFVIADGAYVEPALPDGLDAAIVEANASGIGFVWLDSGDDAQQVADAVLAEFQLLQAPFRTVLALTNESVAATSETAEVPQIDLAFDASFPSFQEGDVPGALSAFTQALTAEVGADVTAPVAPGVDTTVAVDPGADPTETSVPVQEQPESSGGGGFGVGSIIALIALAGVGYVAVRYLRNRGRVRRQTEEDLEADRAEIKEQLRDNADAVLVLGDRVIESGDTELMRLYEEASAAYQQVSQDIDDATTADEIDALDDTIDHAEWQFQSIEARLDGEAPPPSPAQVEAQLEAQLERERHGGSALGDDESIFGPGSGRRPPARGRQQGPSGGGGLGGSLGQILGGIVLGGGGLGGPRSRRSTRRSGGVPGLGRPGSRSRPPVGAGRRSGGLGGGVLRPSGSRPSGRSPRPPAGSSRRFGSGSRPPQARGRSSRRL